MHLNRYLGLISILLLFCQCKTLLLTENKVPFTENLAGIWQDPNGSERFELERIDQYRYKVSSLCMSEQELKIKAEMTKHKIGQLEFITLKSLEREDEFATLLLSNSNHKSIKLKDFTFSKGFDEQAFKNTPNQFKETIFTQEIKKNGLQELNDQYLFDKIYIRIND